MRRHPLTYRPMRNGQEAILHGTFPFLPYLPDARQEKTSLHGRLTTGGAISNVACYLER